MPDIPNPKRATLSLCIPAYNAATHLPTLLSSARKQSIPFDEILVYDDFSTDNTREVAQSFGAVVICGEKNLGCTWGRKTLAEHVHSDWIHFHDADDDMLDNFTTLAHSWMAKPDAPDVVLFNYDWIDLETGEVLGRTRFDKAKAEESAVIFTLETQVNPFCGLYKTQRFRDAGGPDTDPLVMQCEDIAMHCKLARAGLSFSVEEIVSIVNYGVRNSMSRSEESYHRLPAAIYRVYLKAFLDSETQSEKCQIRRAIGMRMWQNTRHAAWVSQWEIVKLSIELASACGVKQPANDSGLFRVMCKINSYWAVVLREVISRLKRRKGEYWY